MRKHKQAIRSAVNGQWVFVDASDGRPSNGSGDDPLGAGRSGRGRRTGPGDRLAGGTGDRGLGERNLDDQLRRPCPGYPTGRACPVYITGRLLCRDCTRRRQEAFAGTLSASGLTPVRDVLTDIDLPGAACFCGGDMDAPNHEMTLGHRQWTWSQETGIGERQDHRKYATSGRPDLVQR